MYGASMAFVDRSSYILAKALACCLFVGGRLSSNNTGVSKGFGAYIALIICQLLPCFTFNLERVFLHCPVALVWSKDRRYLIKVILFQSLLSYAIFLSKAVSSSVQKGGDIPPPDGTDLLVAILIADDIPLFSLSTLWILRPYIFLH